MHKTPARKQPRAGGGHRTLVRALVATLSAFSAGMGALASNAASMHHLQDASSPAGAADSSTGQEAPRSWRRSFPDTPAGARLADLLRAIAGGEGDVEDFLAPSFFAHTPEALFTQTLRSWQERAGSLEFVRTLRVAPDGLGVEARSTKTGEPWTIALQLDAQQDKIVSLSVSPQQARPEGAVVFDTWDEVEREFASFDGDVGLAVYALDESMETLYPLAELGAENPLNIAQVGTLFTIGAAAVAAQTGEVAWDQGVVMEERFRSLPPTRYAGVEAGQDVAFEELLLAAGSMSDSTASDALFHTLGRERIAGFRDAVLEDPSPHADPHLSAREHAALKVFSSDQDRLAYAQADTVERERLLRERVPVAADMEVGLEQQLAAWDSPREIGTIGWFASASDLAKTLQQLALLARDSETMLPLAKALIAKPRNVVNTGVWPASIVKNGGERGVVAAAWMLRRYDGRWFIVAGIVNDPAKDPSGQRVSAALIGAVDLLAIQDGFEREQDPAKRAQ